MRNIKNDFENNKNVHFDRDTDMIGSLDLKKAYDFYKKEREGRRMLTEEHFRHFTFALFAICKALIHDFEKREKFGHTTTKYGKWIKFSIEQIEKIQNDFFGNSPNYEEYLNIDSKLYRVIIREDKRVLVMLNNFPTGVTYDPIKTPEDPEFDKVKFMIKNFVSEDIYRIITSEDLKGQQAYPCYNSDEEIDFQNCEFEYEYYTWCFVDLMQMNLNIFTDI